MAHWIIEDKGFGGTDYTCSKCGDVWNDLFCKDISTVIDRCPGCGVILNEDEIEYVDCKTKENDLFEEVMTMTNKEAADILKRSFLFLQMARSNGKTTQLLLYNTAMNKAIYALEQMPDDK